MKIKEAKIVRTVVLIISGGMDSATLLACYRDWGFKIFGLSFDYGQRHKKELKCAEDLCKYYGADWKLVDLTTVTPLLSGSALIDKDVPEGKYDEETMRQTVVPNRNAMMLSIAYAYAVSLQADVVAFGAHAGDHFIYPDCREDFILPFELALQKGNFMEGTKKIGIDSPFLFMSKGEIAKRGKALQVPYEKTWTCYKGETVSCGRCGSCTERLEAFWEAGISDPLSYQDSEYWKTHTAYKETT